MTLRPGATIWESSTESSTRSCLLCIDEDWTPISQSELPSTGNHGLAILVREFQMQHDLVDDSVEDSKIVAPVDRLVVIGT